MQLENLCAAMKDAHDARKIRHAATKTPGSQINKYFFKKWQMLWVMAKVPGDGWELLLSGQLPKSAPDACASSSDSWGNHRPCGLGLPLGHCIPQVLVSGEHLTAEAPGDGMAPRFITPPKNMFLYIYIYIYIHIYTHFFFFLLCWILVATQAFSSCGEQGLLFVVVHGLLTAAVSLVAEHRL